MAATASAKRRSSYQPVKKLPNIQLGKAYIFAYNTTQIIGWTYLLIRTLAYFLNRGNLDNFWIEIRGTVLIFQNAAVLEVLHAALGLVHTGVFLTLAQVTSRVFLVCAVLMVSHAGTVSPGLVLCIFAWSITEIIRYSYYAANAVMKVPPLLTLCRYSTFFLLYPLGVSGELLCIYDAIADVSSRKYWAIPVLSDIIARDSQFHLFFSVFYRYMLITCILCYIPMFPMLFVHMMRQRKKILSKLKLY